MQVFAFRVFLLSLASCFVVVFEPAPADLFFILSLLVLLLTVRLEFQMPSQLFWFYVLSVLFLFFNVVSLGNANVFGYGLRYFLITVYMMLIPFVMGHFAVVFGPRGVDGMYLAFIVGAVISSIIGFLAYFGITIGPASLYFKTELQLRLSPLFKDPNVYGPYILSAAAILLGRTIAAAEGIKPVRLVLVAFMLLVMVLTFSRGAWVNAVVTLFLIVFLLFIFAGNPKQKKMLMWIMIAGGTLLFFVMPIVISATGVGDFLVARTHLQAYDNDRFSNWGTFFHLMLRQPVGIGPGHCVGTVYFPQSHCSHDPHNIFLKVAVENGWLGAVSYFGAIGVLMIGLMRIFPLKDGREPIRIAVFAILAGQFVNSLVVDSLHWRHLFYMFGFAAAEIIIARGARAGPTSADDRQSASG